MGNGWPVFHDDIVAALRGVLIAWGPLCGEEERFVKALAVALKVKWDEIAPPQAIATKAGEGDGVDGWNK